MTNCNLCGEQMMDEVGIRIGEMGPMCRECYFMLAVHFANLALLEEIKEEPESEEEEDVEISEARSEGEDYEYGCTSEEEE